MRKAIYLAILIVCLIFSSAYAAKWERLDVPVGHGADALIDQFYAVDRLEILNSYERDAIYGFYFWRKEFYSRPEDGKGQVEYKIYLSRIDVRKKPWVIYDSLLYTKVWFEQPIVEANPQWINRGSVSSDNPENILIAKQVIGKTNELVRQDKVKARNIPIRIQTALVPEDMK
ncbi:hypothetical protein [Selenomonas sp. AB3002]|uniref:hypothetical protein n=1 Tax=Selenomonas sp. AB3002 TaxID=1392502 RepID=UPI000496111A